MTSKVWISLVVDSIFLIYFLRMFIKILMKIIVIIMIITLKIIPKTIPELKVHRAVWAKAQLKCSPISTLAAVEHRESRLPAMCVFRGNTIVVSPNC